MTLRSADGLAAWIALAVALPLLARLEAPAGLGRVAEVAAPLAPCRAHGCGCSHREASTACCCAPGAERPVRRAARAETLRASAPEPSRAAAELPVSTLEAFHCAGGRGGQGLTSPPVAPAIEPGSIAAVGGAPLHPGTAHAEPGPLFDLRSEPDVPPPRRGRASESG